MSEFVYKDYIPANARVIVDYTRKQKVMFSYPRKWSYWEAVWKAAFSVIFALWMTIHAIISAYLIVILLPILLTLVFFFPINIVTSGEVVTYTYDIFLLLTCFGIPMLYIFGVPIIATYMLALDKRRLSTWIPKMGYYTTYLWGMIKEKIFTPKDVVDNKAIIHSFSNVYLDYSCTEDFNKYLKKVEILEIPFNYICKSFLSPFSKKRERNDYDFRAVFYFSECPKNGELRTIFY